MKHWAAAAIALATLTASPLLAQQAPPANPDQQRTLENFQRDLDQYRRDTREAPSKDIPIGQRALVDYGAYLTLSYLTFDTQGATPSDIDHHILHQYEAIGYGRVNIDNVQELYIQGRTFYQDYAPGDGFDNVPDRLQGRIEEAYYRLDLQRYLSAYTNSPTDNKATITLGRQFIEWANSLTLSQYLDAAKIDATYGIFDFTLLGGVTVGYTVDFDTSRPNFDNDTRRGFYGLKVGAQPNPKFHPYAYLLFQQDYNSKDTLSFAGINTIHEYYSWYAGGGVNGTLTDRLLYKTEVTYEGGAGLSNSIDSRGGQAEQRMEEIQAGAADVQLIYVLQDPQKTRLSFETILASGDPDRQDSSATFQGNRTGTKDHAFNSLGYLYDGLAFAPATSNLMVFRVGASTFPLAGQSHFDKLQLGVDLFAYGKFRKEGTINESTDPDERYLGIEPDLAVNWEVLEDVTLTARYGIFFPGDALTADRDRQFFYMAVTYAF